MQMASAGFSSFPHLLYYLGHLADLSILLETFLAPIPSLLRRTFLVCQLYCLQLVVTR